MPCKARGTNLDHSRLRYRGGNNHRIQHRTLWERAYSRRRPVIQH
jgi:hypothetical protein